MQGGSAFFHRPLIESTDNFQNSFRNIIQVSNSMDPCADPEILPEGSNLTTFYLRGEDPNSTNYKSGQ